jgi:hypothetical protein
LSKRLEFEIERTLKRVEVSLRSEPLAEGSLGEPLEFD